MKKPLFSTMLLGSAMALFAQSPQALNSDRNAFRADDRIVKQQVEFKDPGSCGRNLTWDFRMLQPINESYSLKYFIPDSTHLTRICGMEHNTRYYYRQQPDSLWATGFENATTFMQYTTPELRMHYPFQYGDTLFTQFEGKGEYCHRMGLHVKGYTRVEVDAEGDLLLPNWATVKKATRVRTLRHYTEIGKDSVEMILDTYGWYANGYRYPVFESIKTTVKKAKNAAQTSASEFPSPQGDSAGGEVNVFSTSFYYPPELQSAQVLTNVPLDDSNNAAQGAATVFTEAQLLPNPVVDNLMINYTLTRPAQIWFSVHNNMGIALRSTSPQQLPAGANTATVAMSGLKTGVYSLYVHVDDMVIRMNVIKK